MTTTHAHKARTCAVRQCVCRFVVRVRVRDRWRSERWRREQRRARMYGYIGRGGKSGRALRVRPAARRTHARARARDRTTTPRAKRTARPRRADPARAPRSTQPDAAHRADPTWVHARTTHADARSATPDHPQANTTRYPSYKPHCRSRGDRSQRDGGTAKGDGSVVRARVVGQPARDPRPFPTACLDHAGRVVGRGEAQIDVVCTVRNDDGDDGLAYVGQDSTRVASQGERRKGAGHAEWNAGPACADRGGTYPPPLHGSRRPLLNRMFEPKLRMWSAKFSPPK